VRDLDMLIRLLEDVPGAVSRYGVRDHTDRSMDTLKVIENPDGGYLGVYHALAGDGFAVHVATSTDMLSWTHRAELDRPASQPTIAVLGDGRFVVALEAGGSGRAAWLKVLHYGDVERLLCGAADHAVDLPHTQVPPGELAEGTPNIYSAVGPVPGDSLIDLGFHYFRDGDVDRQARGTLTGFRHWTAEPQPHLDAAIEVHGVRGNIGDRDHLVWRDHPVNVHEGQLLKGRWDTWRVFVYDWATGVARPVRIRTHGGSTSFGNPCVTALTAPSGAPALLVTAFVFGEGSAPGEGGQLVYFRETS
jgi:hypothetical protein